MRHPVLIGVAVAALACKRPDRGEAGKRIFHVGLRSSVGSLDPVRAASQANAQALSAVYETLFEYEYGTKPLRLVPLLAEAMPEASEDLRTYRFAIRRGVRFHDDPCFPGGAGRELVARDVVYSMARMADASLIPTGWWLYAGRIAGFDDFAKAEPFDVDRPIAGLRATGSHTLEIELVEPYPQLLYVLATMYTAVVPRECAERHGKDFARRPVGTGPFRFEAWSPNRVSFARSPSYWAPGVPKLDGIVMHLFEQDQPMWLLFRAQDLDLVQAPAEYQPSAFDAEWGLRPSFRADGVGAHRYDLTDLVYRGFDMEHPITGGFGSGKLVRQAITAAIDTAEIGEAFYNDAIAIFDGPIPPGLDGHDPTKSKYRGPNLELARALLAEAGHPNGEGLQPIAYHTHRATGTIEQVEMLARQLARIGVRIEANFHSFPELDSKIKKKQCQMFGLAWNADYPDAENFLALFYGPNASPGANAFNYRNDEYDRLYAESRLMPPSAERTQIYRRMRAIIVEDAPITGTFSRKRAYLWNARVKPLVPDEIWYTWMKHVEVLPR